jgi:hypothetical protein
MCGNSIALLTKLRGDRCLSHIVREGSPSPDVLQGGTVGCTCSNGARADCNMGPSANRAPLTFELPTRARSVRIVVPLRRRSEPTQFGPSTSHGVETVRSAILTRMIFPHWSAVTHSQFSAASSIRFMPCARSICAFTSSIFRAASLRSRSDERPLD